MQSWIAGKAGDTHAFARKRNRGGVIDKFIAENGSEAITQNFIMLQQPLPARGETQWAFIIFLQSEIDFRMRHRQSFNHFARIVCLLRRTRSGQRGNRYALAKALRKTKWV